MNTPHHNEQLSQDDFLGNIANQQCFVSIYLINGIKLQGSIIGYDKHVIFLRQNLTNDRSAKRQMVFKHAISTILEMEATK